MAPLLCYPPAIQSDRVQVCRSYLRGIEATSASTVAAFARHVHDRFGIGVIQSGAQRSASGPVEAGPGDVIQSHMNRAFVRRLGATPGAYAASRT
jgi:hypothetical protein